MATKKTTAKKTNTNTKVEPKKPVESVLSVMESNPSADISKPVEEERMVEVVCLTPFYDLEAKMERGAGARWEVTESRAGLLNKLGIALVV